MRWPVFAIFAFVFVVLQLSLRNAMTLHSMGGISPDIVGCMAAYVALFAHRHAALWACWLLGIAMDLAPQERAVNYYLIGEHALGYVFGALAILQLRTMVFRRRAMTAGFMTLVFLAGASIVAVFIMSVRSWYTPETFLHGGAFGELLRRLAIALYSGVVGIAVGWLLNVTIPLWGFQSGATRRVRAMA
jgi:cell shape-determining protein MreD